MSHRFRRQVFGLISTLLTVWGFSGLAAEPPTLGETVASPAGVGEANSHQIDRFIGERWEQLKHSPKFTEPVLCNDSTFLRRVYLDVIGVVPTLVETRRFLDAVESDKRARLIDELLARSEDYAAHWTVFWLDAFASNLATTFGGVISRGNHLPWVQASFATNKPYNLFVSELLDPTLPGFKKPGHVDILGIRYEVGFLRHANHNEVLQTAADVGQIFLGTGMKCASCHQHFDNDEWPQERFLAFAGLFNDKDLEKIRCEKRRGIFVPAASPFPQAGIPQPIPNSLNGRLHLAATFITDPANPRFAKTLVNRLWKRYLGLGLFEPVDDFRLDTPASHPALLDWLAADFIAHNFNIKWTTRQILTSKTYQLQYRPSGEGLPDPLHPSEEARSFRSPVARRLTAEQILDSIAVITAQKLQDGQRVYRKYENVPDALNTALGRPDIRSEVSTARSGEVAIVQALELLNGARYQSLMQPDVLLGTLGENPSPSAIIERLYLATLQRKPTDSELSLGVEYLQTSPAEGKVSTRDAVTDILWAIFTSPGFQYIH